MRTAIGVGAQKCGTTWLADYLRRHPDVAMAPVKEMHFFDSKHTEINKGAIRSRYWSKKIIASHFAPDAGLEWSKRLLLTAIAPGVIAGSDAAYRLYHRALGAGGRLSVEITPSYSLLDAEGFRALDRVVPGARFIFLVRNPADRFWSQLRFTGAVDGSGDVAAKAEEMLGSQRFMLRSDYVRTISAIREVVERDRIFVGFYEDLFSPDKGVGACASICRFLGIRMIEPDLKKIVHRSAPLPCPPALRARLMQAFAQNYMFFQDEFGDDLPTSWNRDVEALAG